MPAARVRVYDAIRSAHLERFRTMTPATVLYAGQRYDFDPELIGSLDLRPMGRVATVVHLLRTPYEAVELNEPLMTYRWTDLALQLAAVRLGARWRRRPVVIGAYCISLTDPVAKLQSRRRHRLPLPGPVARVWARLVLRFLVRRYDRLAFGTDATRELLGEFVAEDVLASRSRMFLALGSPCTCDADPVRDMSLVLFVGAFDERKGIRLLLRAWDEVRAADPGLRLHLVGQGALRGEVEAWASGRDEVTVTIDPPRADVHRAYRGAHVVVLLSQRSGYWREQVGLPIVEALSHGCEVVATDETGLAEWLREHGHRVVPASSSAAVVANAIGSAAASTRTRPDIVVDLPAVDTRWAADRWLLSDPDLTDAAAGDSGQ